MKPKTALRSFTISLALLGAGVLVIAFRPRPSLIPEFSSEERLDSYLLLLEDLPEQTTDYIEYLRRFPMREPEGAEALELLDTPGMLDPDASMDFSPRIDSPGSYSVVIRHRREDKGLSRTPVGLRIDGDFPFAEARSLELPRRWSDESKVFSRDRYNDESPPLQHPSEDWVEEPLRDTSGRTVHPVLIALKEGRHRIQLTNLGAYPVELGSVRLEPAQEPPSYAEYRSGISSAGSSALSSEAPITINAVMYQGKNSYDVRMGALTDPSVSPSHPVDRLLNVIDGASWDASGEEIHYEFEVPRDCSCTLTLHYSNPRADLSAFRTIRIDGEIPFAEAAAYELPATGGTRWAMETLGESRGEAYRFFLEAGSHVLSLRAEQEPAAQAIRSLKTIIAHMNFFGIEIIKVTGREIDENRRWRLTDYLEKTPDYLEAYRILVADMIREISRYTTKGSDSAVTASLITALFKLERLSENPDELPLHLQDIYSTSIYDRPVTQILGDTVNLLEDARLSLNAVHFDPEPAFRRANAPWYRKIAGMIQSLAATYTSDKYVQGAREGELDIWVSRAVTHIDLMQKMSDGDFTRQTDIPVRVSTMPEPNRLILAAAGGDTPDIAMGLPSFIPFDLAIRGAALELSGFPDFWSFASGFSPGAFIPYVLNEDVYGMPETLDFHTLVYRRDIFRRLDLVPPDTWEDVMEMLPTLQRFGMNFYHPIAGGLPTLKWFYQTSPFIYQFGGSLYSSDGLSVSLDDPRTVAGLTFLSELFSLYALERQVPIFYNSFRFGVIPVGILESQTYLQLKYAAPELTGQWGLAPYPGIPDESGEPRRWFIANGTAALILEDSERHAESWDYLKWWLSANTQSDFGYRLQSTYGPEYLWVSANLNALKDSPIDPDDKRIILEQVRWQRDVPRTPAQYMLERGLSDIWINSAVRNQGVRTEIDSMIPVINREVRRKMIEFGFIDAEGNILKPFSVPGMDWVQRNFDLRGEAAP